MAIKLILHRYKTDVTWDPSIPLGQWGHGSPLKPIFSFSIILCVGLNLQIDHYL